MIFHSSGVDADSVNSHDAGTNVDLGCFKVSDCTAIMAEEDFVYIYLKDATRFEKAWGNNNNASTYETMEQCYVRLGVAEGKEFDVVKDLTNAMTSGSNALKSSLVFDAVNSVWPIPNLTSIQIRRQLTTHTIASD